MIMHFSQIEVAKQFLLEVQALPPLKFLVCIPGWKVGDAEDFSKEGY